MSTLSTLQIQIPTPTTVYTPLSPAYVPSSDHDPSPMYPSPASSPTNQDNLGTLFEEFDFQSFDAETEPEPISLDFFTLIRNPHELLVPFELLDPLGGVLEPLEPLEPLIKPVKICATSDQWDLIQQCLEGSACAICLESLSNASSVIELSCTYGSEAEGKHFFCAGDCIKQLSDHNIHTCPQCRQQINNNPIQWSRKRPRESRESRESVKRPRSIIV